MASPTDSVRQAVDDQILDREVDVANRLLRLVHLERTTDALRRRQLPGVESELVPDRRGSGWCRAPCSGARHRPASSPAPCRCSPCGSRRPCGEVSWRTPSQFGRATGNISIRSRTIDQALSTDTDDGVVDLLLRVLPQGGETAHLGRYGTALAHASRHAEPCRHRRSRGHLRAASARPSRPRAAERRDRSGAS